MALNHHVRIIDVITLRKPLKRSPTYAIAETSKEKKTMRHVTFSLRDGSEVTLEIETVGRPGQQPVARAQVIERALQSFEEGIKPVIGSATVLIDSLNDALRAHTPDEIHVGFGLKASAELNGLMVAKAATEANYAVTVVWKPRAGKT